MIAADPPFLFWYGNHIFSLRPLVEDLAFLAQKSPNENEKFFNKKWT